MNLNNNNNNLINLKGCGIGCLSILVLPICIAFPPLLVILAILVIGYMLVNGKKYFDLKNKLSNLEKENSSLKLDIENIKLTKDQTEFIDLSNDLIKLKISIENLENRKKILDNDVINLEESFLMQSFGFFEPKYGLENSVEYKSKLDEIRSMQKTMLKNKTATIHSLDWNIDYDAKKGKEFILDTIKLTLRAFNNECDNIINKSKFNNLDLSEKRIYKVFNDLNSLTDMQKVSISNEYLSLKIEELYIKYEYECKKQEEKEEQQAIKERMREEAKVFKEIEAAKKKIEKEETHFKNAIEDLNLKISSSLNDKEKDKLSIKLKELESKLSEIENSKKDVMNREKNTRAGYVYVISNIGSFGENVYKIGMTRRLDPNERIRELGSASVPFNFDIHAMIFSEDAPALENLLHKKFEKYSVNKVNLRKEFFEVSLEDIESEVKSNHNAVIEFTKIAEASDYRKSYALKSQLSLN